jgi:hypothetical protein
LEPLARHFADEQASIPAFNIVLSAVYERRSRCKLTHLGFGVKATNKQI